MFKLKELFLKFEESKNIFGFCELFLIILALLGLAGVLVLKEYKKFSCAFKGDNGNGAG